MFPFKKEQNAARARDGAPRRGTTVSSVAHHRCAHDPRAMLVVMNRRLASEPSRSPRRLVSATRPGGPYPRDVPRARVGASPNPPPRTPRRSTCAIERDAGHVSVTSGEVLRVRRARRRFDPRLARTTRVRIARTARASSPPASPFSSPSFAERLRQFVRARAARRLSETAASRPRRRTRSERRTSRISPRRLFSALPSPPPPTRASRTPRRSARDATSPDVGPRRCRRRTRAVGFELPRGLCSRRRFASGGFAKVRGDDAGAADSTKRARLGGGHGRDSSSGAGARGFRGGAAAASAARRASSRAETGVPPPRHPGLPRAADDDLVVVVAVATVLCRCRSSRRAVGARVLGSVLEVEVEGDGSSAEISRADASTDVHHRSSLADASSARDGCSGVGGVSGTAAVSFARLSDADRASSRALARARASASFSARVTSRGGSTIRRRIPSTNAPTSSASRMTV